MSLPLVLIKFTKSKKYFGVPPFVIISGAAFATLVAGMSLSNPKNLRRATAPPDPTAKSISLRVWSTFSPANLFSNSLLTFSAEEAVPTKFLISFAILGNAFSKN